MIRISNLTKLYAGYSSPISRIFAAASFGFLGADRSFVALRNIDLQIQPGEVLGLIGRNGAGKSTLLKVLSKVSPFDSGKLEIDGTVRSILELGVGFNPELSGRENVFYNGLVSGYSPKEILEITEEVFDFAGLQEFQEIPLKNYSSGMMMRLGFALATAKRPDIFLVDEALAVGDASFQQKCIRRFEQFRNEGSVIVIVSHDLNVLRSVCDRICILEKGSLVFDGDPITGFREYMQIIADTSRAEFKKEDNQSEVSAWKVELWVAETINPKLIPLGAELCVRIDFETLASTEDLTVGFHIDDSRGIRVYGTNTHLLGREISAYEAGRYCVRFFFPANFAPGKYTIGISIHKGESHALGTYLWKDGVRDFEIERLDTERFDGMLYLPTRVEISETEIL